MRCPDCNKFVSYDDSAEPELDLDVEDLTVTGTVRIMLPCAECGTELKETTFDVEIDFTDDVEAQWPGSTTVEDGKEPQVMLSITDESAEMTSRTQTGENRTLKDGTVKWKTWSPRAFKTFYGVSVEVTVKATRNDGETEDFNGTYADEVPASGMDELV
jgi:hypothetical protein